MESLLPALKEFGFPVFVAAFLLVRIEPTLKNIHSTMARILQFLQDSNHLPLD